MWKGKCRLTAAEFDAGIKTLMADAEHVDCVVVGVAKDARESVTPNCSVSLAEFEELAQAVSELHAEEHLTTTRSTSGPTTTCE